MTLVERLRSWVEPLSDCRGELDELLEEAADALDAKDATIKGQTEGFEALQHSFDEQMKFKDAVIKELSELVAAVRDEDADAYVMGKAWHARAISALGANGRGK